MSIIRRIAYLTTPDCLLKNTWEAVCSSTTVRWCHFTPPPNYDHIVMPEKPKLRIMQRVPQPPPGGRHYKMMKNLKFMRGPELIHNTLIHKQFGIVALSAGRLKAGHLEMVRLTVARGLDTSRMFAVWRIDDPWQAISKRGIGKRHGGGKGPISHYITPIKEGRIIIEIAGKCTLSEVKPFLDVIANNLPFKAAVVDQNTLMAMKRLEEIEERENINPYTYKYLIMNRMCGSPNWVKPIDQKYFGKYV